MADAAKEAHVQNGKRGKHEELKRAELEPTKALTLRGQHAPYMQNRELSWLGSTSLRAAQLHLHLLV